MKTLIFIILLGGNILGQGIYRFDTLSPKFDIQLNAEKFEYGSWNGKTEVSIFYKGFKNPFQVFYLEDTRIFLDREGKPESASIKEKRNGKWSAVYLEDINFDGHADLGVIDGRNGGYSATSYRIYLYDPVKRKFTPSTSFTRLAQGPFFGMPEIDRKRKTLEVFWKSGAGFHEIQRYKVVKNRPVKIYQYSEDSMVNDGNRYITTKKLIKGKWRTWEKTVKDSG